jgi:hypothetical protein
MRNLLIDTYRHNKVRALPESRCYAPDREEEFTMDDFSSEWLEADPQAQMRNKDIRAVVELALGGLTPPNREALLLQYRDELSPKEMAAARDVSIQEVYRRTHAARHQFGKCLPAAVLARLAPGRCPEFAATFRSGMPLDPGRRVRMVHHARKCAVCRALVLKYVRPEEILVLFPTLLWQERLHLHGTAPDGFPSGTSAPAASSTTFAWFKDLSRLWQRSSARLAAVIGILIAIGVSVSLVVPRPAKEPVTATAMAVPTPSVVPTPTFNALALPAATVTANPTRDHGTSDNPQLALDGIGTVHLVWQDIRPRSTGLDILHKQLPLASSWSETVSLTDGFDVITPGSLSLLHNPSGQLCACWDGATTAASTHLGLYMRCWDANHWTPPQLVGNTSATMRDIRPVYLQDSAVRLVYTANRGDIFFGDTPLAAARGSELAVMPALAVDSAGDTTWSGYAWAAFRGMVRCPPSGDWSTATPWMAAGTGQTPGRCLTAMPR